MNLCKIHNCKLTSVSGLGVPQEYFCNACYQEQNPQQLITEISWPPKLSGIAIEV